MVARGLSAIAIIDLRKVIPSIDMPLHASQKNLIVAKGSKKKEGGGGRYPKSAPFYKDKVPL